MSHHNEKPLSESLESGDGFVAPRYRSGQRSADALLEAGRFLLADISYEALSINDLCSQANLTKGAFYRRFESKDAFFLAMQRLALDDAERVLHSLMQEMDQHGNATKAAGHLRLVVDAVRAWHLRHRGVIRASLQRRDHTTDGWQPFKEFARGFVDEVASRLARLPELRRNKEAATRLKIGFQSVIATMVNAALNDPGPLHLSDTAMTEALTEMLALYVAGSAAASP
ncbi:helix-turn-helix domain-containing protein [Paraburkholderia sp. J76]|uniref:TetR/AcrR family transcriptional regulator n=1 Tax=Paraburkholderia sp. J76 TaxID=2805439 RepID=UPI002ABD2A83|nr:helix-turn-helix domain-containing protein [Paraburkholderia sp. J76]